MVLKEFIRILRSSAKIRIKLENVLKLNFSVLIRSSAFPVTGDVTVVKIIIIRFIISTIYPIKGKVCW